MRLTLSILAVLILVAVAPAAPAPGAPTTTPLVHQDAVAYATELVRISREISERYLRPVNSAELCYAGLSALYQTAEAPLPGYLKDDLEKAGGIAFFQRIVQCRESLGNSEFLRDQADLLISCRAMCKCLDSYSVVVTGTDLQHSIGREINSGVGLELNDNGGSGPVRIRNVVPGGPAQRADVRPGDEIIQVDGKALDGISSEEVMRRLNSTSQDEVAQTGLPAPLPAAPDDKQTGPVVLMLRRNTEKNTRTISLQGEEFRPETILGVRRAIDNSWSYWVDRERKIAQLRIVALSSGTPDEMVRVLTQLKHDEVKGIVIDLRWCPGGLLNSAVELTGLFLKEGSEIATIRSRKEGDSKLTVKDGPKFTDLPVVVLINQDSSGGAELIAAALQDHRRAAIVGQRSLGKGNVQTFIPLAMREASLKLSSATFIRPSGKPLHRFADSKLTDDWGVRPDPGLECRTSPELTRQLRNLWQRQTLRPGASDWVLPLDDPEMDVQRVQAVQFLVERQN